MTTILFDEIWGLEAQQHGYTSLDSVLALNHLEGCWNTKAQMSVKGACVTIVLWTDLIVAFGGYDA